ncbi:hypothetical protein C1701_24735 [Actinoalloteichus sp. AHMU CJ021]|uniref:serine hydrolase n=1 Tax=Actinoalloteichus sp. AHMU CJ021 TaxID=2072503 RepID=UPI000CA02B1F|nr:hypothetical protein C1701_24735 [Actinoalloteichus sp. AHMU CJ021]
MTPTGSGAISTATDMFAFGRAHLPHAENPLLTPDTTRQMQEQQAGDPRLPGIGHLWELRDHNGRRLVTKAGDLPGFHTSLTLVPAEDTVLYLAFNGDGDDGAASTLTTTLANNIIDELFPHGTEGTEDPPAADLPTPATFTGTFRSSRESRTEPHGVQALIASVTISLAEDGRLRTQGPLSHNVDPDGQTWTQIAPGLFQQDDGAERLAFREDGRHLQVGSAPIVTFERLAWYESPQPHLLIIAVATLLALATALGLPAVALVRRLRRRTPPALNRVARAGRWATWLASCALIGVLLALVALLVDGSAINEVLFLGNSLALALLPWIGGVLVVGVVASLALVATAWYRRWWGVGERCHHSVTVLALVAFVLVGHHYGILG